MSQLEKTIQFDPVAVPPTSVMTGDRDRSRFLYYQLKMSIQRAERIDIIVSFLMESGVRMLLKDLREALERQVPIRILTGNYLGITQPSALYLIKKELGEQVDLRFYNETGRSFHPKSYMFHYPGYSEIYIGSSNVSRSALTSGIEWNYRFSSETDPSNFLMFYETFNDLFQNHSIVIDDAELKRYSKNWHKPAVSADLARYDLAEESSKNAAANRSGSSTLDVRTNVDTDINADINKTTDTSIFSLFQPRGVQIEALYALRDSRAEGATKGLVQAATGIGKTYLAVFDSAGYQHVLFVAHREEILKQAAVAFRNVRRSEDYGFFCGWEKATDKSVIFASVATLGREEYLTEQYFPSDYFDYIVIDEFHHAVNEQYRRIIRYFHPKFLLGLTATPERMDGRDIYEICDYNVPYELSLREAINKGVLVPFHYYGVYDATDYSSVHLVRGHYDEQELTALYRGNMNRHDLIYKHYRKYHSRRALGFCCSRAHAEEMAGEFSQRGIPSVAVYSNANGEFSEERDRAVERLRQEEIRVIFSVDMFNEGLDIASVDLVMFLRPTESPIVFLQQLGRGLRTSKGKEYLTVLDFIGNYEMAGKCLGLLSGDGHAEAESGAANTESGTEPKYPDGCQVDFDIHLIDLFEEMGKRSLTMKERIGQEYRRIRELQNGKVPTRMELFTYMQGDIYEYCIRHAKENPFRRYLEFVKEQGDLTEAEEQLYGSICREFIAILETTDMQKVYKMPILYSFYNHGELRMEVTEEQVLAAWKEFFDTGTNWKDFHAGITYEEYRKMSDRQHLSKAKSMPVKFLKSSGKGFFIEKEGFVLAIREELRAWITNPALVAQMKDILEYRTMEYYRRRYVAEKVD